MRETDYQQAVAFDSLNIQAIETNAGIFIGNNEQNFWSSHSKRNEAEGRLTGRNYVHDPTNIIIDNDFFDLYIKNDRGKS